MSKLEATELIVEDNQAGQRLDQFLASQLSNQSRAECQRVIKASRVSINQQVITNPAKALRNGDSIKISGKKEPEEYKTFNLPIIFEHQDWLIVDKPSGLLTHAKGRPNNESTVVSLLVDKVESDGTNRAGIVHRLDRATSGLMLVAKNREAQRILQKLFSERKVNKQYLSLVDGVVMDDEAELNWPIGRNPKLPSQFRADKRGKPALTNLTVLSRLKNVTELLLKPKTGRTHQLRVHLTTYGHPILGEAIYAPIEITNKAERLCLHASGLEFNYKGEDYKFESPWPDEIVKLKQRYEK